MANSINMEAGLGMELSPNAGGPGQITLLSETDGHGRILFVNDAFCRVSKYQRSQLIGKSHNIIRHPDMPKELFGRLWDTILGGGIFKAVIKNKASDGSHYWINATIMALHDRNKRIEKCIAVRHLITDDHLAEKLFAAQLASLKMMA